MPEVRHGDWSAASGFEIGLRLAADPAVTAVFAANDQMALGLLRALHQLGVDVPGRVSVVGFDGTEESGFSRPPLTTVRQDFASLGRRSVETLLAEIRTGAPDPGFRTVPVELLVRGSTAPRSSKPGT